MAYTVDGWTYESRREYAEHQADMRRSLGNWTNDELKDLIRNIDAPVYIRAHAMRLLDERHTDEK